MKPGSWERRRGSGEELALESPCACAGSVMSSRAARAVPGADVSLPPLQACRDFLDLAETHSRKWQRVLQYEREQRIRLEETIEQLAKQHNSLERACRGAPGLSSSSTGITSTAKGERRQAGPQGRSWVLLLGQSPAGSPGAFCLVVPSKSAGMGGMHKAMPCVPVIFFLMDPIMP